MKLIRQFFLFTLLLFFLFNSSVHAEVFIKCIFNNVDLESKFKNDLTDEGKTYAKLFLPLDVEFDFLVKDKNNWKLKKIRTSVYEKWDKNDEGDQLILKMFNDEMLNEAISTKPDLVYPNNNVNLDTLTGEKLTHHVIIGWVLDNGVLIRNKFEYPKLLSHNNTSALLQIQYTDGNLLVDNKGECTNNDLANQNTREQNNSDKSIKQKLLELKELYDQELITQDEYDAKRKEILDAM